MISLRSKKFHGHFEPTAKQEKEWLQRITLYAQQHGSFPQRSQGNFDRHHVKGRTFAHKKVHLGRWLVIPVEEEFHHVMSNNPLNVTHYKSRYEEAFGTQIEQFLEMCEQIKNEDGFLPMADQVIIAAKSL
ncbi:hypothetical protein ACU63D_000288 [Vibrio parahaemolyticus]|uniref:hypothetical protein n=1 Tax=Vibrio parahaemolyticus TaxID=670 RepID=UPI000B51DACC|nr:hypothetical protein [Vibrio parahaemolyticus]EGQ8036377.1 hypothetical protein [Vibrio parahaemolyticus]EGR9043547.1 hypothetical protein [Vibrio parahaemolyticus]EHH2497238.1 hypothetical protein [Vibrio parahaemolyticus]EID4329006.1 hypothetical protein [Vibrio parahaemolyticus]EJI1399478.1 hypothetical protein [Vibrio parahaemolyticus]